MDRRLFLKRAAKGAASAGIAGALGPRIASGQDDSEEDPNVFVLSRLSFKNVSTATDYWNVLPDSDEAFLQYLASVTNIKLTRRSWSERVIDIKELGEAYRHPEKHSRVYSQPFLFMTSGAKFRFAEAEKATLGEFFKRGGFLYADDCVERGQSYFYHSFIEEIRGALPEHEMKPVPLDNAIYHCVYDFPNGAPYCQGERAKDMGLFYKDRLVAFLTSGDLHCGWNPRFGGYASPRELCWKMGVNIILYALTH